MSVELSPLYTSEVWKGHEFREMHPKLVVENTVQNGTLLVCLLLAVMQCVSAYIMPSCSPIYVS